MFSPCIALSRSIGMDTEMQEQARECLEGFFCRIPQTNLKHELTQD
jgi:hypothetical protein